MSKKAIKDEIDLTEATIFRLSQRVRSMSEIDSMSDWIATVLQAETDLAKYLHLPSDKKTRNALLVIIRSNSQLSHPVINLLANRIGAYIATLTDLYNLPMRGKKLDPLLDNFQPLIDLLAKYRSNHEHAKTISSISDALKRQRLHIFKSGPREPDLRVALRAFYEDKNRENRAAVLNILEFIALQLRSEVRQSGYIAQPRHLWWAILTLVAEGRRAWLIARKMELNRVVKHALHQLEYLPKIDADFTSIAPELDSTYNEKTWTTINAIRILKKDIAQYVSAKTAKLLREKIDSNIAAILELTPEHSLKHLQSKLIFLYEALSYYSFVESLEMANQKTLNLSGKNIGILLYADEVLEQYQAIISSIISFVNDPAKLKKPTLGAMLLSGAAGQGKSELVKQVLAEVGALAKSSGREFIMELFTIGTEISTAQSLAATLEALEVVNNPNAIRVVVFDEFDKASFDFYTPFLPFLETAAGPNAPVTFWMFAQSSFSNFSLLNSYSQTLPNKAMRDFITRLQLGHIDLPELKASSQQRILTTIGLARSAEPLLKRISKHCLLYFAANDSLLNNRDLMKEFSRNAEVIDNDLLLSRAFVRKLKSSDTRFTVADRWINLELS